MGPRIQYAQTKDRMSIAIVAGSSRSLARTWVREVTVSPMIFVIVSVRGALCCW